MNSRALARCATALLAVVIAAAAMPNAPAQSIDVSLNLQYNNQSDPDSGGMWQLAVKTDQFGLAAISIAIQDILPPSPETSILTPQGEVNNGDFAGLFGNVASFAEAGYYGFVAGYFPITSGEQNRFYGVGSIDDPDGAGPNYIDQDPNVGTLGPQLTTLTNLQNALWGTGDFLDSTDWDQAAILFQGTFAAGQTPSFYVNETTGNATRGRVYSTLPTLATEVGTLSDQVDATTVVRTDLGQQIAGDYNGDGVVDLGDYNVWRDNLGATVSPVGILADGTRDGMITAADYDIWKTNFGTVAPASLLQPGLTATAVPEPQTLSFLGLAISILGIGRRFRRRSDCTEHAAFQDFT